MHKHKELEALIKGASKADRVGAHEYFVNRFGADSVGPLSDYLRKKWQRWTLEMCKAEALKYETRGAFRKGSRAAFDAAQRLKIMNEVCAHMTLGNRSHTAESIAAEALKYETRLAFKTGSKSAYHAALRLKIKEQVCAHMPKRAKYRILKK